MSVMHGEQPIHNRDEGLEISGKCKVEIWQVQKIILQIHCREFKHSKANKWHKFVMNFRKKSELNRK